MKKKYETHFEKITNSCFRTTYSFEGQIMVKLRINKKRNNFGKNVKVMTSFVDVTIVETKIEYVQRIALAESFNLIYCL